MLFRFKKFRFVSFLIRSKIRGHPSCGHFFFTLLYSATTFHDNVTRFSGQNMVDYCLISILIMATTLDTDPLHIFVLFIPYVAKIKNCRVPSSGRYFICKYCDYSLAAALHKTFFATFLRTPICFQRKRRKMFR